MSIPLSAKRGHCTRAEHSRMLYNDRLETSIDNSQSTNSGKTLKIFNVYSSLGLKKIMSQFFNDHEIQSPGSKLINCGREKI